MTYNPYATTHAEAATLCGLTLHPCSHNTPGGNKCELHDASGAVVFAGYHWPDSWQYMQQHCGLVAQPALPVDWYSNKGRATGEVTE